MSVRDELVAAQGALTRAIEQLPAPDVPIGRELLANDSLSFQHALDAADPGDTIVLDAGFRFERTFRVGAKPNGPPIRVHGSRHDQLAARRITPADASLLPTITSGSGAPTFDGLGATRFTFDGLHVPMPRGQDEAFVFGDAESIVLDRILLLAEGDNKRGVRGNGRGITLIRSHVANIWRVGQETQGFCAWDGAGPYAILNSYLDVAGINILFGGADSTSPDRVPSDIRIASNHLTKNRAEWYPVRRPIGPGRVVKNLIELKAARNVHIHDNLLEHSWTDGQDGWAMLITPRNQYGKAPWSAVQHVTVERNYSRHTENFANIAGHDDEGGPSGQTADILLRKNVVETSGRFLQFSGEIDTLTVEANVVQQGYNIATVYLGSFLLPDGMTRLATFAARRLNFNRNVLRHNEYGIFGDGGYIATDALRRFVTEYECIENQLVDIPSWHRYPVTTTSIDEATLQQAKAALLAELGR